MKHTFSILVKNDPGVLCDVISVLGEKGCNIDSLAVGVTESDSYSRITIVSGSEYTDEMISSISKNPNVVRAKLLALGSFLERSHVLIKVKADSETRSQVLQVSDIFRAKAVDVSKNTVTLEITGDETKIAALTEMLKDFGIEEIVRSGVVAVQRGEEKL